MKMLINSVKTLIIASALALYAHADQYNQDVTAIFGNGNPDSGWTTDTNSGVTVALRDKDRVTGDTTNVNGLYQHQLGINPATGKSYAQLEFSMNAGSGSLTDYDWLLTVNGISVNPFIPFADMSLGTSATANGAGVETGAFGSFPIAQNSESYSFLGSFGVDFSVDSTYDISLSAFNKGTKNLVTDVGIQAQFGAGSPPSQSVPDNGSTLALLGGTMLLLGAAKTGALKGLVGLKALAGSVLS